MDIQVATRMRAARKRAGLKVSDIAAAWGCSPSNVSHALAGRQSVTADQLVVFARLVGVTASSLLGEQRGKVGR